MSYRKAFKRNVGRGASRYCCSKDNNHDEIAKAAEQLCWTVFDTHKLPHFLDMIWIKAGQNIYIEVKNPDANGKVNPQQQETIDRLESAGAIVEVVEDVDDVIIISQRKYE